MLCPKCRQPLDDDAEGVYICCADASLRWHCTQCAKVSEGFAFPYGRCPHCGGKLEVQDTGRVDEVGALEGIRLAFEIELGGVPSTSAPRPTAASRRCASCSAASR